MEILNFPKFNGAQKSLRQTNKHQVHNKQEVQVHFINLTYKIFNIYIYFLHLIMNFFLVSIETFLCILFNTIQYPYNNSQLNSHD